MQINHVVGGLTSGVVEGGVLSEAHTLALLRTTSGDGAVFDVENHACF